MSNRSNASFNRITNIGPGDFDKPEPTSFETYLDDSLELHADVNAAAVAFAKRQTPVPGVDLDWDEIAHYCEVSIDEDVDADGYHANLMGQIASGEIEGISYHEVWQDWMRVLTLRAQHHIWENIDEFAAAMWSQQASMDHH